MVEIKRKHERDAPRSWFSLFLATGGWLAIVVLGLLLIATYASVSNLMQAERFERNGVTVYATVMDKSRAWNGRATQHFVTFSFSTGDGRKQIIKRKVGADYYARAIVDKSQPIRYLASDPSDMETYVGQANNNALMFYLLASLSGVAGLAILWFLGHKAAKGVLARRFGQDATATVVEVVEVSGVSGEKSGRGYLIWHDEFGDKGVSLMLPIAEAMRHRKGDKLRVFRRNEESWWEGDVGPRKPD